MRILGTVFFMALIFLIGCQKSSDESTDIKKGNGILVLKITDAPFPAELVDEANVIIDYIKLKKSSSEEMGDDNDSEFVLIEKDTTINLLDLSNGITKILATLEVPAGSYNEIRLHVVEASLKLMDDTTSFKLRIPSGTSSGLKVKIIPGLLVEDGVRSEVLLDFDVSRSFKIIGNTKNKHGIKGFMFNPVVRAVNTTGAGKISGTVKSENAEKLQNAWVTLIMGNDTIASSKSTKDGFYAIIGIPAGTYDLTCSKEGYNDEMKEKITIIAGKEEKIDFVLKK